jgi:hypothetical protein
VLLDKLYRFCVSRSPSLGVCVGVFFLVTVSLSFNSCCFFFSRSPKLLPSMKNCKYLVQRVLISTNTKKMQGLHQRPTAPSSY